MRNLGDYLLISEAARLCNVTPRAIQYEVKKGKAGAFPGAVLVEDAPKPYFRLPQKEVLAYKQKRDQRTG